MSKFSAHTLYRDASYLDRQQRLISELLNAALFDIIEYFQKEKQSFIEYFTKEFLDSLNEKVKNSNHLLKDKVSNEVFSRLSKTSNDCKLPMPDLIHHLRYAIIGFGDRLNDFADPLQEYIRKTESPTLAEFNKTLHFSWALTRTEVNLFDGLFQLYCIILLSPSDQEIVEDESLEPLLRQEDLKCIWIESDVEKYYPAFDMTIKPARNDKYTPEQFLSEISNDWAKARIFLCLSATNAPNLLPKLRGKVKIYRTYVLCNEKSQENQFLQDDESFGKIRLVTSDEQTFLKRLALDIVPS
jgi:hypothetical protein